MRKLSIILLLLPLAAMVVSGQPLGQMNLADPFIYLEGDTYYAFGTESNDGFRCYRSEDLEHWVQVKRKAKSGFVLHREDPSGSKGFWAPEVYFLDGRYFMLYTADEKPCIAVADDISGPFNPKCFTKCFTTPYGKTKWCNNRHFSTTFGIRNGLTV